jgi:hypothetical protein
MIVSNNGAYISQIKKYLNGELDEHAMHRLERQAQEDSFFKDALEGYQKKGVDQQLHLNDLSARLQQRIRKGWVTLIPWRTLAIAASFLLAITIGSYWLLHKSQPTKNYVANLIPSKTNKADTDKIKTKKDSVLPAARELKVAINKQHVINNKKPPGVKKIILQAPSAVADFRTGTDVQQNAAQYGYAAPKADTTPVNEVVVSGVQTQQKKETGAKIVQLKSDLHVETEPDKNIMDGQALGLRVPKETSTPFLIRPEPPRNITGIVTDQTDGQPIIGAYVRVEGRNSGTVTDANGHFIIPQVTNKETLAVEFIGYSPRKIAVKNQDSIKVSLSPSQRMLAEVSIVKNNSTDGTDYPISAYPQQGWSAYKKYIREHAVSPGGQKGTVKLSFTVGRDGVLTDFKVLKGLSDTTNKAAINLIKSAAAWIGNSNGKPEEVRVKVEFK